MSAAVDDFLSDSADAIEEWETWHGSEDAASWSASGDHEPDEIQGDYYAYDNVAAIWGADRESSNWGAYSHQISAAWLESMRESVGRMAEQIRISGYRMAQMSRVWTEPNTTAIYPSVRLRGAPPQWFVFDGLPQYQRAERHGLTGATANILAAPRKPDPLSPPRPRLHLFHGDAPEWSKQVEPPAPALSHDEPDRPRRRGVKAQQSTYGRNQ